MTLSEAIRQGLNPLEQCGWMVYEVFVCPTETDCDETRTVLEMYGHLHFKHQWPAQQIVEWVATVEPKESPSSFS